MSLYKNKKVVVTGGSGFVGTNMVLELLNRGANVRTSTHKSPMQIQDDRIELLENIDLTKFDDAMTLIDGADIVIHCAGDILHPTTVATDFQVGLSHINIITNILEASYRNSSNVDVSLTKINRSNYQGLSSKTQEGTPTQYFVQRFINKVTITLYLTPGSTEAGNLLNYYYVSRIQDAGNYSNEADVPYRFVPCMVAGLAYYLAVKYAPDRIQMLKMLYEDELNRALTEDGSSSSSFITPKTYYPGT